ncbi:uncharacterized protein LOC127712756 [Mytilus californianus]|uniref:uncharacterized protein LOC127712756 n=1 Tax=Mytilus californianus TaxID=6549 RepID=UPI0022479AD3|nr:uncharacterized protein LOC127712756 [Mytilus californianus]
MDGIGSKMTPEERYFRSLYLMYQVCTEVVRHYFDDKHPPDHLVQYLLDKRLEFEKADRKIPNYQWIQLYPEALFRADVNITEKYIEPCYKTDYKEFANRMKTIFTYIFDTVDGEQEVKLAKTSSSGPGEVLTSFEISSLYNPDGSKIKEALEQLVNGGNVDASLEISDSPDGFSLDKQGDKHDKYTMVINLTKKYDAALGQKDSQEFKMMAKGIERILHFLYDSVPGTQLCQVEEFRSLPSTNCISAKCNLTSVDLKNEKKLKDTIKKQISEGRLGKTLTTTCSPTGFSFKDVIVFESEIKVDKQFSKNLTNGDHPDYKVFVDRVQPIIKGLYDSSIGEQDVEIVRCRDEKPDTMFVVFHLISHGNNDEEELRKVVRREIRTGLLSLNHEITADGFKFESNKCMFNVKVKLAEKYPGYKYLANPTSDAFKSFKEKVQQEILRLYDPVCGVQEIDIYKYKIESSGADHFLIFKLISRDCSDENSLKEPIETQIQTGLLGSSLKVCTSDLVFQKLAEKVVYQVSLNVKRQFTEELKKKHSAEFMAFSKFVQTVLNTHYEHDEKVPGKQEVNVVECQQGPSVNSTDVILEIISHGCTDEVVVRQPFKDLIAVGKLELTLKTSATDFTFKTVRGSKPVSSEWFDLSLLITLLRKDSKVIPPKNGYDVLPPKDDDSHGAQIATIKHYRNELAHASDAKMDEHKFDSLQSNLKNAVRILGKDDKFMKAVYDASTMKLDSSTEEVLIRMVQHDRQVLQLEEDVTELYQKIEKLTKQTEEQSASTQVEISEIKEEIWKKEEQILENKAIIQNLYTELHRIEKKFDEKFRVQDERNVQQDEKNKDMGSGIEENRRRIQENRRDIQRIDTKNEDRRILIDQTKAMIQNEANVYVMTRAVAKCTEVLDQNQILVLAADGGRGKTALSLYLAKLFLEDNNSSYKPLLFVEKEIVLKRELIDFKENYVIIIEDLFGRSNVKFDDETHKNILDILNSNMKGEQCNCKLILTVRKTPGSHFDLFDKHEIFKEARIINLDDENFALTRDEKENILINHLKQFSVSTCNCRYRNWLYSDTCYELCMEMPGNTLELCYKVVEDILNVDTYYGFPQACRLFSSNPSFTKMGVKYFQNPNKALVEEIESLHTGAFENSVIEQYQFCILVYLAVEDEIDLSTVDKIFFRHLLDKFGNSNYNPNVLKRSVKGISDKYLVGDFTRGPCRLQHATIREAILISYGKDYPDEILSHCSFDFFSEYFRPQDFKGIYICIEDKKIINYLMPKVPFVDINIIKQYIEKVSLNLCTKTSDQVLSFFKNSTKLLDDGKYSGILNALMGQSVPDQFEPYNGQILKELLKMEDVDIITKFIRPNGCLIQEKNAVNVDNEILAGRLLNILVGISYCSTFSPNDSYNDFANTCDEQYIFDETSGTVDKAKQNAIGRYLYRVGLQSDGKIFVEKFLSMVEKHIRNINPNILGYMIDGLTERGQRKEIVSQYKIFCEKNLFRYGSIDVVLNLCCPSSYEGSSNSFVKVDNRLLAEKLLSCLTVQRQVQRPEMNVDFSGDYGSDSDDYDYDDYQDDDNESEDYDSDFCDPLVEEVGEYVYKFGIEENDEIFITAIASELSVLFDKRDSEEILPWEHQTGRYLDRNLYKHFFYKGLNCKENRENIEQFPNLDAFLEDLNL